MLRNRFLIFLGCIFGPKICEKKTKTINAKLACLLEGPGVLLVVLKALRPGKNPTSQGSGEG